VQDDIQELYVLLNQAKGIVLASPVYNGGVSAQTKTIMDRCRAAVAADKNFFKGKIGMGIVVGGDRAGGQELALMQIHTLYILNGMIPVSGGFFGANLGATLWSKDTLDGIKQDEEGFRSLKKTVKRFSEYLEKYGKEAST
jgi:multimeric flavodoxin WrbA